MAGLAAQQLILKANRWEAFSPFLIPDLNSSRGDCHILGINHWEVYFMGQLGWAMVHSDIIVFLSVCVLR